MSTQSRLIAKVEAEEPVQKLAVLIDADNAQATAIEGILAEVARFGEATVKRIYGDFTAPTSAQWKKFLQRFSIKPIQQFAYTTGKNATDSTLIIEAMDLLYTRRFDGFCLVSSDSDFTALAIRIREEGLTVYGFGEKKTPEAFRNACNKFVFTEILRPTIPETNNSQDIVVTTIDKVEISDNDRKFFLEALEKSADEQGWTELGTFGGYLSKIKSDFDARNYGYKKLSELVKERKEIFEYKEQQSDVGNNKIIYVRSRR